MNEHNDNRSFAVAGIVLRRDTVLLLRQIWGPAKGRLLVPGGYARNDESPFAAAQREVFEESSVRAIPTAIVSVRYKPGNWNLGIRMTYESGEPQGDGRETTDAQFLRIPDAMDREDVTEFSKKMIMAALAENTGLALTDWAPVDYQGSDYSFYACC